MLDEIFATKTRAEWGEIFDEHDVWWVPLQRDHHLQLQPNRRCPSQSFLRAMAPAHGEHTEEVLQEIGRTGSDIASLREKGVVV